MTSTWWGRGSGASRSAARSRSSRVPSRGVARSGHPSTGVLGSAGVAGGRSSSSELLSSWRRSRGVARGSGGTVRVGPTGVSSSWSLRSGAGWSSFWGALGHRSGRLVGRSIGGGAGVVGNAARVGQADLAGGGQGRLRLSGFLLQQAALRGSVVDGVVDLELGEDAAGDQVVEVAGRLPQLTVALALGRGGQLGALGLERRQAVGVAGLRWPDDRGGVACASGRGDEQLPESLGDEAERRADLAAPDPLVRLPSLGMPGWGSDDVAVGGAVVDAVEYADLVWQAGWLHVQVPAAGAGPYPRPTDGLAAMFGQQPLEVAPAGDLYVDDVERDPAAQPDVRVGPATPPGPDRVGVAGGVVNSTAARSFRDAGQLAAQRQDLDAMRGVGQCRFTGRARVSDRQASVRVGGEELPGARADEGDGIAAPARCGDAMAGTARAAEVLVEGEDSPPALGLVEPIEQGEVAERPCRPARLALYRHLLPTSRDHLGRDAAPLGPGAGLLICAGWAVADQQPDLLAAGGVVEDRGEPLGIRPVAPASHQDGWRRHRDGTSPRSESGSRTRLR